METSQIIQILGLILGWVIVHKLSAMRDIDKARREMISKAADGLNEDTTKLFSTAKDYHTKTRDITLEDSLKMTLQDVSMRTSILNNVCSDSLELTSCRRAILELKKAITSEHFEDEHTAPILSSSDQVKAVAEGILRTKRAFQELKQKQFPPR